MEKINYKTDAKLYVKQTRSFCAGLALLFSVSLALPLGLALPLAVQAASLYFSPSAGSYAVGQNFSVGVYVSSSNQAMNATSGVISFPKDKIGITSLSKTGSIINLWVQDPSFSNSAATINFEGIVLNPGFTGSSGKIISINFKAKAAGNASLNFSSGSVLANDGSGTNILKNLSSAKFAIGIQGLEELKAPKIYSPTHPDQGKWYSNANPKFTWSLSADITAIRTLYNKDPDSQPTIFLSPAVSEQELKNIKDGIWYFHLRLRDASGWSAASRFRFQIDTGKPNYFDIKEIKREDLTEPKVKFTFDSSDAVSGIDHYEIQIDNENFQTWYEGDFYETPVLSPGKHIFIAKAVDKAGNFLANSTEIFVQALESPRIVDYTEKLVEGETFIIKGITYPRITVRMFLQGTDNGKIIEQEVKSNGKGDFSLIWEKKISNGIYKFWLEVIDERGAKSEPTDKFSLIIVLPTIIKILGIAINYLVVIMTLFILIVGALIIILYVWYRFKIWRKKVRKETQDIEKTLRQSFDFLREEIEKQVAKLDGRPGLSEREKEIYDELKEALKISEEAINKEVKDIKDLTEK
ncbi:hypothetical protein KJ786_02255 [Patescibacteria group bacterium]|nr:hypothetical protein [Patescibacteria group bacterium]